MEKFSNHIMRSHQYSEAQAIPKTHLSQTDTTPWFCHAQMTEAQLQLLLLPQHFANPKIEISNHSQDFKQMFDYLSGKLEYTQCSQQLQELISATNTAQLDPQGLFTHAAEFTKLYGTSYTTFVQILEERVSCLNKNFAFATTLPSGIKSYIDRYGVVLNYQKPQEAIETTKLGGKNKTMTLKYGIKLKNTTKVEPKLIERFVDLRKVAASNECQSFILPFITPKHNSPRNSELQLIQPFLMQSKEFANLTPEQLKHNLAGLASLLSDLDILHLHKLGHGDIHDKNVLIKQNNDSFNFYLVDWDFPLIITVQEVNGILTNFRTYTDQKQLIEMLAKTFCKDVVGVSILLTIAKLDESLKGSDIKVYNNLLWQSLTPANQEIAASFGAQEFPLDEQEQKFYKMKKTLTKGQITFRDIIS